MGRQQNIKDPAMVNVGSSIILLQERFKQLQRMKEKREERRKVEYVEVAKLMLSSAEDDDPLALRLNLNMVVTNHNYKNAHHQITFPSSLPPTNPTNFFEKPDLVDTSLRL